MSKFVNLSKSNEFLKNKQSLYNSYNNSVVNNKYNSVTHIMLTYYINFVYFFINYMTNF